MRTYALAVDLKEDPELFRAYDHWHTKVWPEVLDSLKESGILHMDIYRTGNRLLMMLQVDDHFSFEQKKAADLANPKVQEWETLMWNFQQPLPWTPAGDKWVLMEKVFDFDAGDYKKTK